MLSVLEAFREQQKRLDPPRNPQRKLGDLLLPGTRQGGHCGAGDDLAACSKCGQQPLMQSAWSLCCSCPCLERVILPRVSWCQEEVCRIRGSTQGPPWTFCARPVLLLESCAAKHRNFGSQQPCSLGRDRTSPDSPASRALGPTMQTPHLGRTTGGRNTNGGRAIAGNWWLPALHGWLLLVVQF